MTRSSVPSPSRSPAATAEPNSEELSPSMCQLDAAVVMVPASGPRNTSARPLLELFPGAPTTRSSPPEPSRFPAARAEPKREPVAGPVMVASGGVVLASRPEKAAPP